MKFVVSQMSTFLHQKGTRRNVGYFLRFLVLLMFLICVYSILFHYIMAYEGQKHTWLTGFYWTLTVMSTLGFGDITFTSDLGRFFSLIVLISGVVLLLVMMPFAFIQYVYSPWLEAQKKTNAPRALSANINDHVIVVGLNPISLNLVQLLTRYGFYCVILCPDTQTSLDLEDQNFHVVVGDYDDGATYKNLGVDNAVLLLALDTDIRNTNIIFSAREVNDFIPVIAKAENEDSVDILSLAGATKVLQFRKMLGEALARRVVEYKGSFSYLSAFSSLLIAEHSVDNTTLLSKTLLESNVRAKVGINIVGLWKKGRFVNPSPHEVLSQGTTLVMAGTKEQFEDFDKEFCIDIENTQAHKVLIIGGGKVGFAAAEELYAHGIEVVVVDKVHVRGLSDGIRTILGDASDIDILKEAGIDESASVMITTHDDDTNIYLTIYCRQLRPDIQILTRASLERNINILHRAGANIVLSLVSMMSNSVVNLLAPGKVFMLRDGLSLFSATIDKSLIGKNLIDSKIREKTGCSVVGIKMEDGSIQVNPDPSYQFSKDDEIYLIGDTASQNTFIDTFGIKTF